MGSLRSDGGSEQGADHVRQRDGKFESVIYGPDAITALSKDEHDGVLVSDVRQGTFRFTAEGIQKLEPPIPGNLHGESRDNCCSSRRSG